jgi:hypothetical protein
MIQPLHLALSQKHALLARLCDHPYTDANTWRWLVGWLAHNRSASLSHNFARTFQHTSLRTADYARTYVRPIIDLLVQYEQHPVAHVVDRLAIELWNQGHIEHALQVKNIVPWLEQHQ